MPVETDIPEEVYDKFEELTMHLIHHGWERYSADGILHRIRWHFRVDKGRREFKCNNNWTSHLARWFMARHPRHAGFFETRERISFRTDD